MTKTLNFCILVCIALLFVDCSSSSRLNKSRKSVKGMIEESAVFKQHFTGFVLYDPSSGVTLTDVQGSKYFTPASNTKLLTLYTALNVLPDSLPSFRYFRSGDQLTIKGMGDPTLLHPLWPDHPGFKMLEKASSLTWIKDQSVGSAWGPGWAWDDYTEAYQAEISDLPLYGNLVRFTASGPKSRYQVFPSYFQTKWTIKHTNHGEPRRSRMIAENEFGLTPPDSAGTWYLPYKVDPQTTIRLLEDTLAHSVNYRWIESLDKNSNWNIAYGVPVDSVYAEMMKVSDNFIAEQLLVVCSAFLFDSLDSEKMIEYSKAHFLNSVPDTLQWEDGSGLSRYNLFTPRSVVHVLDKIKNKLSWERIQRIFPAGGVSGTIKRWYPGLSLPYIWAKTGSLSNNHSLSGYIQTTSGRILIFSFMHSNYTGSVSPIRLEMRKTLEYIRDNF